MDNGFDGKLADTFSGLGLVDPPSDVQSNNDNLFQVMKAVEAAEATIKQQVEENNRLRNELHEKILDLEQYKAYVFSRRPHPVDSWSENVHGTHGPHHVGIPEGVIQSMAHSSTNDQPGTLVVHKDLNQESGDTDRQTRGESPLENSKMNGRFHVVPADYSCFTQLSSPSTSSISPSRYQTEVEYDRRLRSSGHGLMSLAEVNNPSSLQKQDLIQKVKEHDREIAQFRRHLAEYSVKEAQIHNEIYVLEKRIAYMRLAFDQQQQDLADAASKALSYRQDIMEENIRLSYQLQAAQQERLTFVSSLLPLLSEYSLQPPVPDVQSIASNVKVLFKHLQEQLNITESKLKESQFQLTPWHSEANSPTLAVQLPHSVGAALAYSNKNGLQLVPQPAFTPGKIPISSEDQVAGGWHVLDQHEIGLGGLLPKTMEPEQLGRFSPFASRNLVIHDVPGLSDATRGQANVASQNKETNKQVKFHEPISNSDMHDTDAEALHNEGESTANWQSRNSPYTAPLEDPSSSYSPFLPPVLEEPSSSFFEGDAFPGRELQACGYSINGTTSCNFEWKRHMEDGSVNFIEGAKQPNYLVTADDVDTYLAIEVQHLDNRKRKGELVKVFANDYRKITCDPEMRNYIEKTLYNGHASYKVSLSTGYLDIWKPATLAVKREGYSIKCGGSSGVIITEKYSPNTIVNIPYGHATVFSIRSSNGTEHILREENSSEDVSCSRDTIVLTLRLFIIQAGKKGQGKKRSLFFNK